MKFIALTQGKQAVVDDDDFDKLSKFKWYALCDSKEVLFYAVRNNIGKNKPTTIRMHRVIMDAPDGLLVDHISHDPLDNRKQNLRICTQAENQRNRKGVNIGSTSGIRGIHKNGNNWMARIGINGVIKNLGTFKRKEDAAATYLRANKKYFGEFGGNQ